MNDAFSLAAAACGVLHNVFYQKPSQALLDELSQTELLDHWPEFEQPVAPAIALIRTALAEQDQTALEREHYRLFIGPGPMEAYPWGSVYTDKENLMFGETTRELEQFCRDKGIAFELTQREPVDHIGLILAILNHLFEQQDEEGVKVLLGQHLLPWSHRFIEAVEQANPSGYYRGFAQLLAILLADWQQRLAVQPRELILYR
ncbi:TorD/DmsD family molecular chaperone [Ferrimonas marina]|uniref:Chaperone TorD involved in molybdoenzyme TorA maturation n=1 Tax=Ferrimonas marina TaxID=299255 RepID=A0A1M5XUJ4_9GAMM|nr:molecular chaperone TorD family protein [Ferrimonas marina]SHI03392.1 chaperone TorD involved in molybdoenzyme TorA maturation [Ferrimonas marina]